MMEKRNVIESGRTPDETVKLAEVVDEGVEAFMKKTGIKPKEKPDEPARQKDKA